MSNYKVKKAVIPAAGLGTRFLPATKAIAKEILPIIDKPAIQFIVEEALAAGIEDILIITGKGKQEIEDHFDANFTLEQNLKAKGKDKLLKLATETSNLNIHYTRQDHPRGLGDAVRHAKAFIGNDPFLLLLGDDIIRGDNLSQRIIELYEEYNQTIIAGVRVDPDQTKNYGILDIQATQKPQVYQILDMVEKPQDHAPSNLAAAGRYILEPQIFEILDTLEPGTTGEVELTDALIEFQKSHPLLAYEYEGEWFEVGDAKGMLKAAIIFALDHPEIKNEFIPYIKQVAKKFETHNEKD
ncbi:UTP--glucose-1-phosphate uridylyltransferase [Facklamia miroungae]|uniref:UTP--glucose-1-phosphate uridylyltransferase n=1 Tax=Facklamia miroungae TaxID=120956 RepID=A0A1G7PER5_9LACT|nr:UTP--glucose-1-phosphate uridylyltransferase [Facklamia miroungae]NKZ28685.1 UTP--glucose-1-phosphate uridylyltransferase [Facklamia miroungae]SDF84717.1 UTP--glucose-1-phosphate uridylyltransferase [Facklamia miroungae]